MGLIDGILQFSQDRAFIKGAEWYGAGQALEQSGHFGPATRCYDEARDLFGRAEDANMYKAIGRAKVCKEQAEARGEEVEAAFQFESKQIITNPEAFVASYYQGQPPQKLWERFDCLRYYKDWEGILRTATAAREYLNLTSEQTYISGDYNVAYFSGLANLRLNNFQNAVLDLKNAYDKSRRYPFEATTLAWDAMHLGEAMLKLGDETGLKYIKEAIKRFTILHASGQDWAYKAQHDAMDILADSYIQRLGEKYTKALDSAQAFISLDEDLKPPEDYRITGVWNTALQRSQAFLLSHQLCERIEGYLLRKEYILATEVMTEINQVSKKAVNLGLTKRVSELQRELTLSDPRYLTHHAATIRQSIQKGIFLKADNLCAELVSRHIGNPLVETITQNIIVAKRGYVDKQLVHTVQLICKKDADGAEKAYHQAMKIAQPIGYEPATGAQVRARLSHLRAIQWGLQAKELASKGNYRRALDLLRVSVDLPNLSTDVAIKLQKLTKALRQQQYAAANTAYKKMECMLKAEKWEQAREFAQKAVELGSDERLAPLVERVRRHFVGIELVSDAQKLVQNRKYHAAIEKADEAVSSAGEDVSVARAAEEVKEDAEQMLSRIEDNLASENAEGVAGIGAIIFGLASTGLLWQLADQGLLYSLWLGFTVLVCTFGVLLCACTGSVLAHSEGFHGLSIAICGSVTFGLSWVLPWWGAALIALVCLGVANWLLGLYCPAQDPSKDPEEPDSTQASGASTSG